MHMDIKGDINKYENINRRKNEEDCSRHKCGNVIIKEKSNWGKIEVKWFSF